MTTRSVTCDCLQQYACDNRAAWAQQLQGTWTKQGTWTSDTAQAPAGALVVVQLHLPLYISNMWLEMQVMTDLEVQELSQGEGGVSHKGGGHDGSQLGPVSLLESRVTQGLQHWQLALQACDCIS